MYCVHMTAIVDKGMGDKWIDLSESVCVCGGSDKAHAVICMSEMTARAQQTDRQQTDRHAMNARKEYNKYTMDGWMDGLKCMAWVHVGQ
mmetsp:Transcript_6532/g.18878  ORF Transcript_6532/g.18878 Transcript_6532/m.18878 type:complete len:89 (+) Transcript_6532:1031-1297(+)